MIAIGCACNKNRTAATAAGLVGQASGTYRVMVKGRKVYESTNQAAAATVAANFPGAVTLSPGETE